MRRDWVTEDLAMLRKWLSELDLHSLSNWTMTYFEAVDEKALVNMTARRRKQVLGENEGNHSWMFPNLPVSMILTNESSQNTTGCWSLSSIRPHLASAIGQTIQPPADLGKWQPGILSFSSGEHSQRVQKQPYNSWQINVFISWY